MIVSIARASANEAARANVFGAWSDLVVGDRPDGLVDCYLLNSADDDTVQVVAMWASREHHDRAVHEDGAHPAYTVFETAGLDCTHTVLSVMGSIHQR